MHLVVLGLKGTGVSPQLSIRRSFSNSYSGTCICVNKFRSLRTVYDRQERTKPSPRLPRRCSSWKARLGVSHILKIPRDSSPLPCGLTFEQLQNVLSSYRLRRPRAFCLNRDESRSQWSNPPASLLAWHRRESCPWPTSPLPATSAGCRDGPIPALHALVTNRRHAPCRNRVSRLRRNHRPCA